MLIVCTRDMFELNAGKGSNKFLHNTPIGNKSIFLQRELSVDLLDDEPTISLYQCFMNPHLQFKDEPYDKSLIFRFVIGIRKLELERQRNSGGIKII